MHEEQSKMSGNKVTKNPDFSIHDKQSKRPRRSILRSLLITLLSVFVIFAFLLVTVAIIALVTGHKSTESTENKVAATVKTIGQPADDAGFRFVVNSLNCGEKRISYYNGIVNNIADAQGRFCRLNITVTNIGNSAHSIRTYNQYVFNAKGQKYDYDAGATGRAAHYDLGNPLDDDINPGNSITGDIVFDVPLDVTPTTAELHGDIEGSGIRINLQ